MQFSTHIPRLPDMGSNYNVQLITTINVFYISLISHRDIRNVLMLYRKRRPIYKMKHNQVFIQIYIYSWGLYIFYVIYRWIFVQSKYFLVHKFKRDIYRRNITEYVPLSKLKELSFNYIRLDYLLVVLSFKLYFTYNTRKFVFYFSFYRYPSNALFIINNTLILFT